MQRVTVYSTMSCAFCWQAKRLLGLKGIDYEEIDIMDNAGRRSEMIRLAGGRSIVPQIFIGGRHIGGFNQLAALDKAGELDFLLNAR